MRIILINLIKRFWKPLLLALIILSALGYFYYLKSRLSLYIKAADSLAHAVETTDKDNHRLRQDLTTLDELLTARQEKYQEVNKNLVIQDKEREKLKNEDPKAREYYNSNVPQSVIKRMSSW